MAYSIISITQKYAQQILTWTYDPPYDLYDLIIEDLPGLLNPAYRYHVVLNEEGELVGYCCFGEDARVPGGDYEQGEPGVLDLGVGLRPDLTGQGYGKGFVGAILEYGARIYNPEVFRVTVAAFNQRSLRSFRSLGFKDKGSFTRTLVEVDFIQLEKPIQVETNR